MTPKLPAALRADCAACVGLCCVIPPFDAVQGFGFDKPAETPCRHLCEDHRCGIHAELIDRGFEGCVAFDCLGAGQRLTTLARERFGSADWRRRPEVARWLFDRYPQCRELQSWCAQLALVADRVPAGLGRSLDQLWEQLDTVTPQEWISWRQRVTTTLAALR